MRARVTPRYGSSEFHDMVAELCAPQPGGRVIDIGCGSGRTLGPLLKIVGPRGDVMGLDRAKQAIELAQSNHGPAAKAGRLGLVETDAEDGIPFPEQGFDVALCQNVFESVGNKAGVIAEIHRILKPGGRLLLGHHDFDGIMLATSDRALTRILVHAHADTVEPWMQQADGQVGRNLPGMVAGARFRSVTSGAHLCVDQNMTGGGAVRALIGELTESGRRAGVDRQRLASWLQDLNGREKAGRFYCAVPWIYIIATR